MISCFSLADDHFLKVLFKTKSKSKSQSQWSNIFPRIQMHKMELVFLEFVFIDGGVCVCVCPFERSDSVLDGE